MSDEWWVREFKRALWRASLTALSRELREHWEQRTENTQRSLREHVGAHPCSLDVLNSICRYLLFLFSHHHHHRHDHWSTILMSLKALIVIRIIVLAKAKERWADEKTYHPSTSLGSPHWPDSLLKTFFRGHVANRGPPANHRHHDENGDYMDGDHDVDYDLTLWH